MVKEQQVTNWAFGNAVFFYILKGINDPDFTNNVFEFSTFALIGVSSLFILASINHLKLLYGPLIGLISFNTVYLGIMLSATKGLGSSSPIIIEGLSRVILALFAIWKLSSDMRNLSLEINPYKVHKNNFEKIFYGILFPPKEFFRMVKILFYVAASFYLVFSGLDLIASSAVNLSFFEETERLSLNILFFGVQTPMMMASRASISKTFSDYLQNLEWAESVYNTSPNANKGFQQILNSNEISYDSISSNGKHIWLTILLMIILQAYRTEIMNLDLFAADIGALFISILNSIQDLF